jgi:hypothetical protein
MIGGVEKFCPVLTFAASNATDDSPLKWIVYLTMASAYHIRLIFANLTSGLHSAPALCSSVVQ